MKPWGRRPYPKGSQCRRKVQVVFMTNGDGFPDGVEKEDQISLPTARDFRGYGRQRQEEAQEALLLRAEGRGSHLSRVSGWRTLLSSVEVPFRCPGVYLSVYQGRQSTAYEMIIPDTEYNGHDLREVIERVLSDFRPNLLALTAPEDQHPDHCSTYHFVRDALRDLERGGKGLKVKVLTFVIHFGQWPVGQGSGTGSHLNPPEGYPDKEAKWITFPLLHEEAEKKRNTIFRYNTQMLVMGRFLLGFARGNELFLIEENGMQKDRGRYRAAGGSGTRNWPIDYVQGS